MRKPRAVPADGGVARVPTLIGGRFLWTRDRGTVGEWRKFPGVSYLTWTLVEGNWDIPSKSKRKEFWNVLDPVQMKRQQTWRAAG